MAIVTAPLLRTTLERHPAAGGGPSVRSVRVAVFRERVGLRVEFEFSGALENVAVPERPLDPDKLWEHTCAEMFLARADGRYVEWNFSPTGQVTRAEFSDYRVRTSVSFDERVEVTVRAGLSAVQLVARGPLLRDVERVERASLSAIVRAPDGRCSYWALRHPTPEPDFHDLRGFTVDGRLLQP